MYNSQYYTCEQVDQRLLQGYLDDYNSENNTNLTKAQFLNLLATHLNSGLTTTDIVQESGNNQDKIMSQAIVTQLLSNLQSNINARDGYYQATINGGAITVNAPNYVLGTGGNLRLKMPAAGTTASTLTIGNANAVQLWYNGAAVSAQNTWEQNEIISVFYDGTRFMASNSQGGGGKAEKISYDHSQSGLSAENVQEALDEICDGIKTQTPLDTDSLQTLAGAISPSSKKWTSSSTSSTNRHISIPIKKGSYYKIVEKTGGANVYAWLKNLSVSLGNSAPLCDGTNVYSIPSNGIIGPAPEDANYLYYRTNAASETSIYPEQVFEIGSVGTKIAEIQEQVDELDNSIEENAIYPIDLQNKALYKGWIGANAFSMSDYGSHIVIPTNGATKMYIAAGLRTAYLYYVKTYSMPTANVSPDFCSGYTARVGFSSQTPVEVDLPQDCNFLIVGVWSNQNDNNIPAYIALNIYNEQTSLDIKQIQEITEKDAYGINFAQGSYGTSGIRNVSTKYLRSNLIKGERTLQVAEEYNIRYLFKFSSENQFVSYSTIDIKRCTIPNDEFYYSIVVNHVDGSDISPEEYVFSTGNEGNVLSSLIDENIKRLSGSVLNVIGDSISNPDRPEYSNSTIWWRIVANTLGIEVGTYSCISGTPVSGSSNTAFHNRVKSLTLNGSITIIAGGMNDLGANNIPLGTFDYSSSLASQINADATLTNSFIPAYRELIEYILTNNKNTRLYLCTITPRAIKKTGMADSQLFFPWTNPSTHNNWAEFNEAIRKLAYDYGIGLIDFANIGMYQQNGFDDESGTLPADNIWTTDGVHPTVAYQKKMGELATKVLIETMF